MSHILTSGNVIAVAAVGAAGLLFYIMKQRSNKELHTLSLKNQHDQELKPNRPTRDEILKCIRVSKPMKLYHTWTYRSSRCTWFIEEAGIQDDFEIINYNPYRASEEEVDCYKKNIHHHGTVPALVVSENNVMTEGVAICMFLAEMYETLLPEAHEWMNYYNWCIYAVGTGDPICKMLYTQLVETEPQRRDKQAIEKLNRRCSEFSQALERHLTGRDYICGDKFTLADIIVGYTVNWTMFMSMSKGIIPSSCGPNLKEYHKRLTSRPAFKKAVGTTQDWVKLEW